MGVGRQPAAGAPPGRDRTAGRWGVPGRFGPVPGAAGPRAPVRPLGQRMSQVGWVLTVIGAVVLGGVVADQVLAGAVEAPVRVTAEVVVQPRSGWRAVRQGGDAVLLTRGSGSLLVVADEGSAGGARSLARDYVERALEPHARGGVRVAPAEPVELASGLLAEGLSYEGEFGAGERAALVQGEVRAVVEPAGTAVVFDAWALPEVYAHTQGDVVGMIETAEVR